MALPLAASGTVADPPYTFDESTGTLTIKSGFVSGNFAGDKTKVLAVNAEEGTVLPENCQNMFSGFSNAVSIDLTNADFSKATNMYGMFFNCQSLESVTFAKDINTAKVLDMSYLFYVCSSLISIDLSGFNTGAVTNMNNMFAGCHLLKSVTFGKNFSTANVTNMSFMFFYCQSLKSIDLSQFKGNMATDMSYMFYNCNNLEAITFSKDFSTAEVLNMEDMFQSCSIIESLDLSMFNTAKVNNMNDMFGWCNKLSNISVGSSWSTNSLTDGSDMFYSCIQLVGGSGTFYNGNGNDAVYAHVDGGSDNPGYLTLSGKESSKPKATITVTAEPTKTTLITGVANRMIGGKFKVEIGGKTTEDIPIQRAILIYDPGKEGKQDVTIRYMGAELEKAFSITLEDKVMPRYIYSDGTVTYFYGKYREGSVTDPSILDGSLANKVVIDESYKDCETPPTKLMFSRFGNARSINGLEYINTSAKNTNMNGMFDALFQITSLDLSTFYVDETTNVKQMFNGCDNLKTIYVSSRWDASNVKEADNMFYGCNAIKGGAGTTYDNHHTDNEYARIDQGKTAPGYLTASAIPINGAGIKLTIAATEFDYTGKAITPEVTVKDGDAALVAGKDYELSYADNTASGTAKAIVKGKGDYKGTAELTFTIKPDPETPVSQVDNNGNTFKVWSANRYVIISAPTGSQYRIYDLAGRLITTSTTTSSPQFVNIARPGIYIVIVNGKSFKVIV